MIFHKPNKFSMEKSKASWNALESWSKRFATERNISLDDIVNYANVTFRLADPLFFESLPKFMEWTASQFHQLHSIHRKKLMRSEELVVYVASGIFRATHGSFMWDRSRFALMLLNRLIPHARITSRYDLLEASKRGDSDKEKILETELGAYVDLEVARTSTFFIPAHCGSSFSYTVQRLKELDKRIFESQIGSPNLSFKEFFF